MQKTSPLFYSSLVKNGETKPHWLSSTKLNENTYIWQACNYIMCQVASVISNSLRPVDLKYLFTDFLLLSLIFRRKVYISFEFQG